MSREEDNPSSAEPTFPTSYDSSPGAGSNAPASYSTYRYPGEGDSASQYTFPAGGSVQEARASYTDVSDIGALANGDYREDGALPAGGPAWGVTDETTSDSGEYGPGVDTRRIG